MQTSNQSIYIFLKLYDRSCCYHHQHWTTQPQGEEPGKPIPYSGRRGGLFQDQGLNPVEETDGRLLPETECKSTPTQLNVTNVRFLFDGERLHENQTPKDLHMENGDEIDVVIEQVGGQFQWSSATPNHLFPSPYYHTNLKLANHSSCRSLPDGGPSRRSPPSTSKSSPLGSYCDGAGYYGLLLLRWLFYRDWLSPGSCWLLLGASSPLSSRADSPTGLPYSSKLPSPSSSISSWGSLGSFSF